MVLGAVAQQRMMQLKASLCGGHGNVNKRQPHDPFVTREAQLQVHEIRRHDEHLLHTAIKVGAHLHAVNALVVENAMVIKSGESVAWLAKL